MKTRYTLLPSIFSLSLLASLPTLAQQQEPAKSKTDTTVRRTYVIKEIDVKEKKREKKVQKKEIGREVVSDRDISRQFILSTKDFVRYMPGVGISESVSRYGNKGFAIRGVDENRVSISVDGLPQAETETNVVFSSYGLINSARPQFETEFIKKVEIKKGSFLLRARHRSSRRCSELRDQGSTYHDRAWANLWNTRENRWRQHGQGAYLFARWCSRL